MRATIVGGLALAVAAAGAVLVPAPAQAFTCRDQALTLGSSASRQVAVDDEWGDPVYFKIRQTGKGRRCTGGVDIFGSTRFPISWGSCHAVNGAWVTMNDVAGVGLPKQRLECGEHLWVDLRNRRLAAGAGDRTGGARVTIDRRWPAGNITFTLPARTQG